MPAPASIESKEPMTAATTCVGCARPIDSPRCPHCGAASKAGPFQIVRLLSQKPWSRLYLATDASGRQVALKELVFTMVPDVKELEDFDRQARILSQLAHPRIPPLLASFREGTGIDLRLYLAHEYVPGESLLELLGHHRFSEKEAREIARQVLEILVYLQGLSPLVIHRDLKPSNLVRKPDGSIALIDFDCARDAVRGRTFGSTLVGTFGYMPPEQLGGTVDATSDLYALGATLLHLLSRKPPEELIGPGLGLVIEGRVSASAAFKQFLARLVAPDPRARFTSAEQALSTLCDLAAWHRQSRPARVALRPAGSFPWRSFARATMPLAVVFGAIALFLFSERSPSGSSEVRAPERLHGPALPPGSLGVGLDPSGSEVPSRALRGEIPTIIGHQFLTDGIRAELVYAQRESKFHGDADAGPRPDMSMLKVVLRALEMEGRRKLVDWRALVQLEARDGRLSQAAFYAAHGDSGAGAEVIEPGESVRIDLTFHVPEALYPIRLRCADGKSFALRD